MPNHCPRATRWIYHELDAWAELPPRDRVQRRDIGPARSQHFRSSSRGAKLPHQPVPNFINHCHPSRRMLLHYPGITIYSRRGKFVLKLRVNAATFSVNCRPACCGGPEVALTPASVEFTGYLLDFWRVCPGATPERGLYIPAPISSHKPPN